MRRILASACLLTSVLAAPAAAEPSRSDAPPEPTSPQDSEPIPTELVERAAARLVQIDLTVTGAREIIESLTTEDFKLKVNTRRIVDFRVDRFCERLQEDDEQIAGNDIAPPSPTVLFYFDQPHMTLAGRQRSLDYARELIKTLIRDGSQAMIVSNASRLAIMQEPTADTQTLLDTLGRLEHDRSQWDFFATEESSRVSRVIEILNQDRDLRRAISTARSFQREERWRTDRNLRRLALTVGRLADLPQPKLVIYFADTLRSNPGAHYLSFFGDLVRRSSPELQEGELDAFSGGLSFDGLVNEAVAQGVRFYPVQAEGLFSPFELDQLQPGGLGLTKTASMSSGTRFRAAQKTLGDLARETGGSAFVRGEPVRRILERIQEDLACVYVLSFDPGDVATDAPLRIKAEVTRPGVRSRSRGRLIVQSESARLTSRLLSAFAMKGKTDGIVEVDANLVATGFSSGKYDALLQISIPAATLPAARWELGASIIYRDKVREEISGQLTASRPDVPLVLEREVRLRPGSHEIVAVAHETTSDLVLSERLEIDWPDPDERRATAGPIALLQPVDGAFARDGATRTTGSFARSGPDLLWADRPTALTSLVCRGKRNRDDLRVERTLVGSSEVEFPDLKLSPSEERCAQIRDLIPARMLGPGQYRYVVRVFSGENLLDEQFREIATAAP